MAAKLFCFTFIFVIIIAGAKSDDEKNAKNSFGRNLLKNPSGEYGLKYWKLTKGQMSGRYDDISDDIDDDFNDDINDDINDDELEKKINDVTSIKSDVNDAVVAVKENNGDNHENDSRNENDIEKKNEANVPSTNNESSNDIKHEINEPSSSSPAESSTSSESSNADINTNNDSTGANKIGDLKLDNLDVNVDSKDDWIIENPPVRAPLPPTEPEFENKTHCFANTYYECYKEQVIDLIKEGFTADILDEMQPLIEISEWYCSREDCPAFYDLRVILLDQSNKKLDEFIFKDTLEGSRQNIWINVKHEFKNYGKGLRKIRFIDGGRDQKYWAGHYGSKMAGAYVKVIVSDVVIDKN